MLIIGVTGGVASGKTTVSRMFEQEGAYLIEADQIARELVAPRRSAWKEIVHVFGKEILQKDGTIDRKRLAERVFADSRQRRFLNEILHPRIRREIKKRVREIAQKDPDAIVIFDAPLLVETGFHQEMDRVVVITSKETQQIERLKKRAGLSEEETRRIIASQLPFGEKVKVADFVIKNEGSVREIRKRVKTVFQELRRSAPQVLSGPDSRKRRQKRLMTPYS